MAPNAGVNSQPIENSGGGIRRWQCLPCPPPPPTAAVYLKASYPKMTCLKSCIFLCCLCRGVHPVLRRQHVHEGGDPQHHAHGGRGRLPPLHVPAGLRPPHGRHVPRVGRHAAARAGQRQGQADGQPRYRMRRRSVGSSLPALSSRRRPLCYLCLRVCFGFFLFFFPSWSGFCIRPNTHAH